MYLREKKKQIMYKYKNEYLFVRLSRMRSTSAQRDFRLFQQISLQPKWRLFCR